MLGALLQVIMILRNVLNPVLREFLKAPHPVLDRLIELKGILHIAVFAGDAHDSDIIGNNLFQQGLAGR
ncbi:hypothetical protein D3C87_2131150 [compost metagenome]